MAPTTRRSARIPGARLRIAMVVYGDISRDSRVLREAGSLALDGHEVTIHCLAADPGLAATLPAGVRIAVRRATRSRVVPGTPSPFRDARPGSRWRRPAERVGWLAGYAWNLVTWGRTVVRSAAPADVWHAHDLTGLVAVGPWLGADPRLVYDVHDLFLETGTAARLPPILRRLLDRLERRLARRARAVITVNRPLADALAARLRPLALVIVHNCPPRQPPDESEPPDLLRAATGIPAGAPIVLHHGLLARNRGIETLVAALDEDEVRHAHVVLLGAGELASTLRVEARDPRHGGRLHVLDPVPPDRLLPWVAGADVGALAMPPATANLIASTPNKLFECLAAGVPVVVSDFPAVRSIVCDDPLGPLGVTTDPADPRAVARAIGGLLGLAPAERAGIRRRCAQAARERWNWESEVGGLLAAYDGLAAEVFPG